MHLIKHIAKPYIQGLHLGSYTYLLSHVLDYTLCKSSTLKVIKKQPELYASSTLSNFRNLLGLSPLYYIVADNFLLMNNSTHIQIYKLMYLLLSHNLLFFCIHKVFHTVKSLYPIHRYHHKFVNPIPSNGNAVSVTEYNIAYVMPFLFGAFLFKPNGNTFQVSIAIISILNSIVHSPSLEQLSLGKLALFVVPKHHLLHHEKLTCKYASPLINVDAVYEYMVWCIDMCKMK